MKGIPHKKGGVLSHRGEVHKFNSIKHAKADKRHELQKKAYQKASMLRKYAKLCKAEGIKSDRVKIDMPKGLKSSDTISLGGAAAGDESGESNSSIMQEVSKSGDDRSDSSRAQTNYHPKGFSRMQKAAMQLKDERDQRSKERAEQERMKEEALHRRKQKKKELTQKNKKGQPVLGNHIKSILEKLKKT